MIKYIKPLPISEETLGAYIEGNLPAEEVQRIEQLLEEDTSLRELLTEAKELFWDETAASIYDDYPNFEEEFSLPEIPQRLDWGNENEINTVEDYAINTINDSRDHFVTLTEEPILQEQYVDYIDEQQYDNDIPQTDIEHMDINDVSFDTYENSNDYVDNTNLIDPNINNC